jgi:formamidopyrimidine-DNA glycosylase
VQENVMIEIPESLVLADQLNHALRGRTVAEVTAWQSPHKLAFVYKDPSSYGALLEGRVFTGARGFGSWVEMGWDDHVLAVSEGTSLLYARSECALPRKHQMLLELDDGSFVCASVQMYGAIVGASAGEYDNKYYRVAQDRPAVLSDEFTAGYFQSLIEDPAVQKLSLKAFLATEQRIPGLGNGVLQDILFAARLHPKVKVKGVRPGERECLFRSMVDVLKTMTDGGGRDTERDLFGNPGGYKTRMSKNTVDTPCDSCKTTIVKASYMGGSVYFCPTCQPEPS